MAIPEEIRNVKRPVNTIVVASGNGPLRYAVIERIGCRRTNGRNVPVNGRTVGCVFAIGNQQKYQKNSALFPKPQFTFFSTI